MSLLLNELKKLSAWQKASTVHGFEPNYRADRYGNIIRFEEYRKTTDYGWEIDHIAVIEGVSECAAEHELIVEGIGQVAA